MFTAALTSRLRYAPHSRQAHSLIPRLCRPFGPVRLLQQLQFWCRVHLVLQPTRYVTEAQGIPLAVILTGANRNDVTQLHPLVGAIPPIAGKRGRPLSKPRIVQGDRGYDHDKYRRPLHTAGIVTEIARRGEPHGSGLGKTRWVVERTISWLHNFRRLRIRFERLAFIHEAFMKIACCIICWRKLQNSFC